MGKEQWLCEHSGIEEEGWKQVGERDDWSCGIASVKQNAIQFKRSPSEVLTFCRESGCRRTYGHDGT